MLHDREKRDETIALPAELRRMICELVSMTCALFMRIGKDFEDLWASSRVLANHAQLPGTALKNLRLTNIFWSHSAATVLWHTFSTDFHGDGSRRYMDALLISSAGGIFGSTKRLYISWDPHNGRSTMNIKLLQLLSALPPKSLTRFALGSNFEIDSRTLGLLLQRQSSIQELSVCVYDGARGRSSGTTASRYVAGNLHQLSSLTIFSADSQKGYNAWFLHLTSLTSLEVCGRLDGSKSEFRPWRRPSLLLQNVQSLDLDNMTFKPLSGKIDQWLRMNTLKKLSVRSCQTTGEFLRELAISFAYHPALSLKELTIVDHSRDSLTADHLEPILKLVLSIQHLYVSTMNSEILHVRTAFRPGASLQSFLMDPLHEWKPTNEDLANSPHYYHFDLPNLIESCEDLQELGIHLFPDFFTEWDYDKTFGWFSSGNPGPNERILAYILVRLPYFQYWSLHH